MPRELDVPDLPEEVKSVTIREQKVFDGRSFPLILSPSDAFQDKIAQFWNDWAKKNVKVIEALLLKYGAILFRGFPFDTAKDFDEFTKAYGYNPFLNVGGLGTRVHVVGNVYQATETPPGFELPFHHEMAHIKEYPLIIFLYCDIPAKEGGNTPLALSNVVYRKMAERDPEFVNRLEREGLRYMLVSAERNNPNVPYGRGWQSKFSTSNREEAERKAKAKGYEIEWLEDGSMKTITEVMPAIRLDKRTGKKMWFNSAFTLYLISQYTNDKKNLDIFFPNFESISADKIETLKEIYEEISVSFKWHRKDVVLIDNRTVQHSKDKYSAPPRNNLICFWDDDQGPI